MAIIPGMESVNWFPVMGNAAVWIGRILVAVIILGGFVAIYYIMQFTVKATVIPMYGSGKDGIFSFGKPKTNRVKWINKRTAWKSLFPFGNKLEREPFDDEYMYPGKKIYVFELNDQWIPGRININKSEKEIRADINPVPYYIRNWQSLTHKKNAQEFAKQGFWEENKYLFMMLGTVLFCCIMVGVVIYLTYQYAGGGRADISSLTEAIKGVSNIPGAPR